MRRLVLLSLGLAIALTGLLAPAVSAAPGEQVWVRRFNDRFNGNDSGTSVKVSPDNLRIYVTGTSWQGNARKRDYVTIAYTRGGTPVWGRSFNGHPSGMDRATAMAVSSDGARIFVTGSSYGGSATRHDYATVAYGSNGARLWVARYAGPTNQEDRPSSIAVSADGTRVYVTGRSPGPSWDYATVAHDAVTGAQLWVQRYDSGGTDSATSIGVSRDGTRVYVTGAAPIAESTPSPAIVTIAYDAANGTQLWVGQFLGSGTFDLTFGGGLAVARDGTRVYVTGGFDQADFSHAVTIAYDSDGNELWDREVDAAFGVAIAVTRDGTMVYVGGGKLVEHEGFLTVAYTSTGTQVWRRIYPAGSCGSVEGLVLGRTWIYVAGTATSCGPAEDYTTVAYNKSGEMLWARRYNPANGLDAVGGLALSPDRSRLYVTGRSWGGSPTGYDYATIAYRTG